MMQVLKRIRINELVDFTKQEGTVVFNEELLRFLKSNRTQTLLIPNFIQFSEVFVIFISIHPNCFILV